MIEHRLDVSASYQTLVAIWASILISQVLLFGLIYLTSPELFELDPSKPMLGENPMFVLLIAVESALSLVISIIKSGDYVKQAVDEQKTEHVQTALIIGVALTTSVSLWGVFLAVAFDYQYFFIWMTVGFVATCLHFPRRSDLENASRNSVADAKA